MKFRGTGFGPGIIPSTLGLNVRSGLTGLSDPKGFYVNCPLFPSELFRVDFHF